MESSFLIQGQSKHSVTRDGEGIVIATMKISESIGVLAHGYWCQNKQNNAYKLSHMDSKKHYQVKIKLGSNDIDELDLVINKRIMSLFEELGQIALHLPIFDLQPCKLVSWVEGKKPMDFEVNRSKVKVTKYKSFKVAILSTFNTHEKHS